jgi:basic membrane lipoprotein Med (substrate-binding protein (PBP1-ABC) superfamily)
VLEGTFKSENILGSLKDDFLTLAPFGPAVPADAVGLVNARKDEFTSGKAHPARGGRDRPASLNDGGSPCYTLRYPLSHG